MKLNDVKDRIAKLLAVASNEASAQGEKDNAMMAAQILMDQYNLESDDCVHAEKQFDELAAQITGKRPARWELYLSGFVKKVFGISCYRTENDVRFYGRREKVEMAVSMYGELRHTIVSNAKKRYNSWARGDGAVYAEGFVLGLIQSYDDTLRLRKATGDNALMVRSAEIVAKERQEAKEWLAGEGTHLHKAPRSSGPRGSNAAYNQGVSDGKSTNLSTYGGRQLKLT